MHSTHSTKNLTVLTAAVLLSLLVAAIPAQAQQKELRKVHVIWFVPDPAVIVAKSRGLFTAEGLDVETTVTGSSTQQMRGISNGTYDIASTAFDNVLAWSGKEGAEIVAAAQTADTIVLPLFVRPEIRSWNDLRGRKLAVDAVDTAFALVLRRILLVNGLDLKRGDYELVAVGATGRRLESMKRGDTFAAIINAPVDAQATAAGMVRMDYQREVLQDYSGGVWAVNRAWAQSHKNELVGFLRAWLAGNRWAKDPANREEAIRLVTAGGGLSPQAAAGLLSRLPKDGALNMTGLKAVLDLRTQFGFTLPKGSSLEPYYDLSYYREAQGR
jgi:ABC-type nitrate/sulfonate/bicarbonate transport system substrate-binding protein